MSVRVGTIDECERGSGLQAVAGFVIVVDRRRNICYCEKFVTPSVGVIFVSIG
jgi:hypothetical protein